MTTAQTPWTSKLAPDGKTIISDALGNEIGQFNEGRDADAVLAEMSDEDTKDCLRAEIKSLEADIETFEKQEDELEDLREEVEKLRAKDKAAV